MLEDVWPTFAHAVEDVAFDSVAQYTEILFGANLKELAKRIE